MNDSPQTSNFGKWMALTAALLGWLFDGLEMGLFPLVARPALEELGVAPGSVVKWNGIITALFLVGAATGGVVFGWLGDRIGRVRSMMLSVAVYALLSGACAFAWEPWHIGALRCLAALGMGGEWSLGVALINEIWPDRSRAFLAGLIGAAANVGYLIIALVGLSLTTFVHQLRDSMANAGISESTIHYLIGERNSGWRLLMMVGALPALLTFFIRMYVPESHRWESERAKGAASHWQTRDLLAVVVGSLGACGIVVVWSPIWSSLTGTDELPVPVSVVVTLVGLAVVTIGYLYPLIAYLRRAEAVSAQPGATTVRPGEPPVTVAESQRWQSIIGTMLIAACLSGVALLGTWGTIQQAPTWADQLAQNWPQARSYTQIFASLGAVIGTIIAALLCDIFGRRMTYTLLCVGSLIIVPTLFLGTTPQDWYFLPVVFLVGAITASFYGWLPLYLPELFRTSVRATGQGFGFNFGRVIAAVGVLQLGNLKGLFTPYGWGDSQVYSILSVIYVVGMILIWFVPETKGKPLPE